MNIRYFLLNILLLSFALHSNAQQEVISKPEGIPIPNFFIDNSSLQLIEAEDNYVLFYQNCDFSIQKKGNHQLVLYFPNSKTTKTTELSIPDGNQYVASKVNGDEVIHFYFFHDIRERTIDINWASTSIPTSNSDKKKLIMNSIVNYPVDPKTTTQGYFAESLDKNYFTLVLATFDEKKTIQKFYIVVYNSKFEIDWMQEFTPDFQLKQTDLADVKINNMGKVLVLLNTYNADKRKQYNHELQLLSMYKDNDFTKFSTVTSFGIIQSMKMLVLKNDHYFVAGYYAVKQNATTEGYFTYTFDPRKEKEIVTSYNYKFNDSYKEREATGFAEPAKANNNYDLKCDYLWELPNDFIVMLGEQYLETTTVDPKKKTITYNYFFKNVFYHQFALDGLNAGYDMFPKPQVGTSMKPIKNYAELGLSYAAFLNETTVYLMYNAHISRFDPKGVDQLNSFNSDRQKEACINLVKINKIGDMGKMLIMPPVKDFYYHKLWYSDGWNLIFGLTTKKTYDLEQVRISSEWQWDYSY